MSWSEIKKRKEEEEKKNKSAKTSNSNISKVANTISGSLWKNIGQNIITSQRNAEIRKQKEQQEQKKTSSVQSMPTTYKRTLEPTVTRKMSQGNNASFVKQSDLKNQKLETVQENTTWGNIVNFVKNTGRTLENIKTGAYTNLIGLSQTAIRDISDVDKAYSEGKFAIRNTLLPLLGDKGKQVNNYLNEQEEKNYAKRNEALNSGLQVLSKEKQKANEDIQRNVLGAKLTDSSVATKMAEIAPSIGQQIPGFAFNAISPVASLLYFKGSAEANYYDDAISRGMEEKQAKIYSKLMSYVEAGTEQLSVGNISKGGKTITTALKGAKEEGLKKGLKAGFDVFKETAKEETANTLKSAFKDYGIGVAEEAFQEAITEPIQEFTAMKVAGEDKADWNNMWQRMLQSGFDGALSSAILAGANLGISSCQGIVTKIENGQDFTTEEYNTAIKDASQKIDIEKLTTDQIKEKVNQLKGELQQPQVRVNENFDQEIKTSQNGFSQAEKTEALRQEARNKSFEDVAFEAMNNYESNEVESPLKNRDMDSIGKQTKVNAYQYDNPKVKPYFQEMAQQMGEDLAYIASPENRSTKKGGGTKLSTSTKAMDILHNEQGYSYDQIAKGLQNIIDDKGSENNAISKKIELVIDEQLRNGYNNAFGKYVEPNQEYINTIQGNKEVQSNQENIKTNNKENSKNIDKQKQFDIIQKSNPMTDDYHVGIRNIEDIKTFEEAMQDDESFVYGDYTLEDAQRDLGRGKVTVYSSNPIEQGGFVSTSQNMAKDYAGDGEIYSKEVNINDVAWINGDEGQYAKVENSSQNNISKLEERLSGDELLNTQDFIDEIKSVGAIVDENGYVTLYHTTTTKNAENIRNTGKMSAKEDGIFFSTKKNSQQSEGRGDLTLKFKIPAERLQLDDIFDDNADVRIPLNSKNSTIDVSQYLVNDSNLIENKNNANYEDNYQKAFKDILNKSESEIRTQLNGIIDNIYIGKMPEGNQVVLNVVPENLQKLGVHNRPMLMAPRELRNAILSKDDAIKIGYPIGKNDSYHQLGKDKFYQVLNNLSDPVMVIKENDNKIIVFTEQFDYKGKQIIVPIEINTNSEYNTLEVQDVNIFKSMHGRSSISNYINNLLNKSSKVLYKNAKKIQSLFDNRKVQYPEAINSVSNNSIPQNNQNVKSDNTNINNMQNNQENIQETRLPMKEKQEVKAPLKQGNVQQNQNNNTPGENINWNEIERPENNQKFRKHYRSIIESSNTTAEAKAVAKELMGTDTYEPETNKGQLAQADQRIMTSSPEVELQALRSRVLNGERITSVDIAVGERLIQYFSKTGSAEQLQDAIQTTALAGTSTGQTLQALTILNHQTPQGQVTWLQRSIDKMNKELAKKKGGTITTDADGNIQIVNKQGKDITNKVDLFNLTPEMMNKIMQSENQEQMLQNIDEVYEELGQQVPKSMLEKVDSWRYFSMLANMRTHGRNMIGNFAMGKMQRVKDKIAGGIEDVVSKFNPEMERTKTLRRADKKTKEFAKNDFKNVEVQSRLELNESKFNPQSRLQNARRTFKSDAMENTLGRLFNLNDKLLEAEDGIGLKAGYQKALADYITANKIDVDNITDSQLNKARNYAVQQAKEATFHQANAIASAVAQFENKNLATKLFTGAVLPFKKTPMNVAKAGMEYSPLQIAKSATVDLVNLRKGNISVNQYIDNLSKGITGTGIALVGYALANAGILKASGGDDKDKEKYEEEQGKQSYSIQIAGKTYSLDWLAPTGIPLFIGAETHKLFNQEETEKSTEKKSEEDRLNQAIKGASNLLNAGATAINPMSEMSMISGLTSALSSYNTSDNLGSLGNIMTNAGKSYINQFVPTALGQLAKTTDKYERTTKSTATGTIGKAVDQTINQIKNKIPGLRQTLPIKTDIWGNDVKQEINLPLRAVNNFINPATVKNVSTDKVDMELNKLYEENHSSSLLPDILTKTVQLNKQTYRLSNKEYAEFTKNYGQTSHKLIENFIKTSDYNKLTQEQKETAISNIYSYAKEQNKMDYAKKVNETVKPSTLYTTMKEIEKNGGKQSEYLSYLAKTKGMSKESEKNKVLADSNYSNRTKEIIYTNGTGKDDNLYNNLLSKSHINMTEYLDYKDKVSNKVFSADKDKNGKTVTGSAKAKVINYLNNNITGVGNRLLIAGKSYALQNNEKQKLAQYINSIANTREERIEIYKQLDKNFYVRNGKVYMRVSK